MFEVIGASIDKGTHRLRIPRLSLAIVEGTQIAHLRSCSRAHPSGGPPMPQTPRLIESHTQACTALAAMQLVEAGKVDLEAPVQRSLPGFRVANPAASAEITVRHLLDQTSGLPTSAGELPLAESGGSSGAARRPLSSRYLEPERHTSGRRAWGSHDR